MFAWRRVALHPGVNVLHPNLQAGGFVAARSD